MELFYGLIDNFAQQPSFKYDGKHQFISTFGIILTVILYALIIVLGFTIGKELWEKKSPTITTYLKFYPNPGKINLVNEFFFMISLQNASLQAHIDESIYFSAFKLYHYNKTTDQYRTEYINLTRCSNIINKKSKYYDLIKDVDLYNYYCIDTSKTTDIYINGYWGNHDFVMGGININPCYIKSNTSNCQNTEFINEYLKDKAISYYFVDNFFIGENFTTPIVPYIIEKYFYPSTTKYTKVSLFFQHLTVSNSGDFFHREFRINSFNSDTFVTDDMQQKNVTDSIFELALQTKNQIQVCKREYYSITKWISEITGYYYFFRIICSLLVRSYATSEFYINLISDLYAPVNKKNKNQVQRIIKFENKTNTENIFKSRRKSQVSVVPDNSKSNISIESNSIKNRISQDNINENIKNNIYNLMHIKFIPYEDKNLYIKHFGESKMIKLFNKNINIFNEIGYKYNFYEKFIGLYISKCNTSTKAKLFQLRKKFINEILEIKKYARRSCYFEKIFEGHMSDASNIIKSSLINNQLNQ